MSASEPLVTVSSKNIVLWCPGCEELHAVTRYDSHFDGDVVTPSCGYSLYGKKPRTMQDKQRCHFYMTWGQLFFLSDCTHTLKGRRVAMVPVSEWATEANVKKRGKDSK